MTMAAINTRQSNFELLRLVAILMVLFHHATYVALGEVDQSTVQALPWAAFYRVFSNQLCLVCVNAFVMISGWFGIRATLKGACSLLFQVVFLSALVTIVMGISGHDIKKADTLYALLFGSNYWFFVAYMVLYVLSPIINPFTESATKRTYTNVLIAFFTLETILGFFLGSEFNKGYSALSFIGIYLLGGYLRRYPNPFTTLSAGKDLFIYLALSLVSAAGFYFGKKFWDIGFHLIHYNSPLLILASVYFFLAFSKIQIKSKAINWAAASAFAIYLIQEHPLVKPFYLYFMFTLAETHSGLLYFGAVLGVILIIGFFCILVDQLRIACWKVLIKKCP